MAAPVRQPLSRPCVFFDRDGIVNVRPDPKRYVTRLDDFRMIPEFFEALRAARDAGFAVVIISNQRGVALGMVAESELERMHLHVKEEADRRGLPILDVLVCPFDDDRHPWRKPSPGMLLEAARRHDLDLARSWMVGDQESDILAGRAAGCRTLRLLYGDEPTTADVVVRAVGDMAGALRECLHPVTAGEAE